jgi:L,D-transpeptidase catalytic domain
MRKRSSRHGCHYKKVSVISRCDFRVSRGFKRNVRIAIALSILFCAATSLQAQTSVEIDLEEQMAYLLQNERVVFASPISSGRYGHLTQRGSFKVLEKERTHYSSMYGKIVDARGNTIVADADSDMAVPPGGKFIPAPMHYFMRFAGADGMHAGYLPGYPASHGCVRMPEQYAIAFFNAVSVGTPVTVYGRTPAGRYAGQSRPTFPLGPNRFRDPRFDRRFVPPPPPWWWR